MSRYLRRLSIVALLVVALALVLPGSALAKSYSMPKVAIHAQVQPNGDLDVTEERTYDFSGDYTQVFWNFPKAFTDGYEIAGVRQLSPVARDLTLTEDPTSLDSRPDGQYYVVQEAAQVEIHAYHRTSNAEATFALTYRVKGGAKRYLDCGELYWQPIGREWEQGVGNVSVAIKPPAELAKADVKAWAHGPLTGVVSIAGDGTVTLEVPNLPASTFVEARILYPAESLPSATVLQVAHRQEVMDAEGKLAREANAKRTKARLMMGAIWTVTVLLSFGGIFFAAWAWLKHGKDPKPTFQGQYFREDPRPDLHPAVVGALWNYGTVTDTEIAATLMDLADKGVVRMAPATVDKGGLFGGQEQTFTLERVPEKEAQATDLDKQLLGILFDKVAGGRPSFALTEIEAYAKAHAESFSEAVKTWKSAAEAQADSMGFFDGDSFGWQIGVAMAALFVAIAGIFGAAWAGSFGPACLSVPAGIGMGVFAILMKRRSVEGAELQRTYVAVRDFLKDFSRLEEAPPQSIILWNRFLVLAVVFGVAEQVIEQLRVKLPQVVNDPGFQTSYWWVYAGSYGHSPVSTLSQS
ncbi:MAG TPA: DUF2207 domain-containing protein, partial [Coriobacteriia bacterium]|nr:DUF2207 domain-containing protein [Coriobacteriia bacterium]